MFELNTKFYADSLLYSLSHFEFDSHTVHTLTQWHLPHPLTNSVKLSLFTHAPVSLAPRLQQCHKKHSHYINNGWTFSGQTSHHMQIQITVGDSQKESRGKGQERGTERDFARGDRCRVQCADGVLLNCTLETYMVAGTSVTPINS